MYNANGTDLRIAGMDIWGSIALVSIMLCGCAIVVAKLYDICKNDYILKILGLNDINYAQTAIDKMTN